MYGLLFVHVYGTCSKPSRLNKSRLSRWIIHRCHYCAFTVLRNWHENTVQPVLRQISTGHLIIFSYERRIIILVYVRARERNRVAPINCLACSNSRVTRFSGVSEDSGKHTGSLSLSYSNKNSSGDEIANVNFYAVRPEATRIRWNNAKWCHYAVQGHSRSPILVPIESLHAISY